MLSLLALYLRGEMAEESEADHKDGGADIDLGSDISKLNDAASKGIIGALFLPSATIIGQELATWFREAFDSRKKNIKSHVDAVRKANPDAILEPTPRNADALEVWSKEASAYGPEDELAALWRGILDRILRNGKDNKSLIEMASSLDIADMKLLERLSMNPISNASDSRVNKLVNRGLVYLTLELSRFSKSIVLLIVMALCFFIFDSLINKFYILKDDLIDVSNILNALGLIPVLFMIMLFLSNTFSNDKNRVYFGLLDRRIVLSDEASKIVECFLKYGRKVEAPSSSAPDSLG